MRLLSTIRRLVQVSKVRRVERGPSNKAKSPVEGRAPEVATPKTDLEVGSPGGRGTSAVQGSKVAPVPGQAPRAERPERKSGDSGAVAQDPEKDGHLGAPPRAPNPPDVTVRPIPNAGPKAEPEDHAVLAPPEERRVPDAPGIKVAPNRPVTTPADPGNPGFPASPGLAQSPSRDGTAPPNASQADRGAAAPQALKADPGPPTPHSPSGVARRPPGERPGERIVRRTEIPSPEPGDRVVQPTGRGRQSLG